MRSGERWSCDTFTLPPTVQAQGYVTPRKPFTGELVWASGESNGMWERERLKWRKGLGCGGQEACRAQARIHRPNLVTQFSFGSHRADQV